MVVIIRYGELSLKGQLRRKFENILIGNIWRVCKREGIKGKLEREWGRLYFYSDEENTVAKRLSFVFGIVSTSPAVECESNLKSIAETVEVVVEKLLKEKHFRSFAIRAKRSGEHAFTSIDVARIAGERVKNIDRSLKVDLKNPEVELFIEVREKSYIYTKIFKGFGGLPVGTQSRVLALDPISAWFAMRRGCDVDLTGEVCAELEAWACYRKIGSIDLEFEEAIKSDYPAVFCSYTIDELVSVAEKLKERKMPVLTPFASEKVYSREKVKEILKSITKR